MRITFKRVERIMWEAPTQGASEMKHTTFRWRMHCPFCPGDGYVWAQEWASGWACVRRHWRKHRWEWLSTRGKDVVPELAMCVDEDERLQFRG